MTTKESWRPLLRAPTWAGFVIAGVGVVQFLADRAPGGAIVLVAVIVCAGAVTQLLRTPLLAALGVLASVVAMVLMIGVPLFATFLALMVTAFAIARHGHRRQVLLGAAILMASIAAVAIPELRTGRDGVFGLLYPVVYLGGAAALGWLPRQRDDAAALREQERRLAEQLAAVEERSRLVREMHDVISHGVSLMVVQAEAGSEVLRSRPEAAASAFEAIAGTGRSAMEDLHRMLGLLQDTATDLAALAGRVRTTGMTVLLDVDGGWRSLEDPARLALFRVAQEAITNTLRHAEGAGTISMRYSQERGTATLEVQDDGTGTTAPLPTLGATGIRWTGAGAGSGVGLGTGLVGLRRRLADLGGTLEAAPTGSGGFMVRAVLPLVPR